VVSFFCSSRRRHTRLVSDWSSDVCSSDLRRSSETARRIRAGMRCHVTLAREGGELVARCTEYPECSGRGASRDVALARLRDAVRFWLEACPCDTTADGGLQLEVVREAR